MLLKSNNGFVVCPSSNNRVWTLPDLFAFNGGHPGRRGRPFLHGLRQAKQKERKLLGLLCLGPSDSVKGPYIVLWNIDNSVPDF
jgi:hypothetical protein